MSYRALPKAEIPQSHPVAIFSRYWDEMKGNATLPHRVSFNPSSIPALVPWLLLLEPVRTGSAVEFRYRLAGTGCCEIFGVDLTGKMFGEDLTPEGAEVRRREFLNVISSARPVYSWSGLPINGRDFIKVYRGVFPVTTGNGEADRIFVVLADENLRLDEKPAIAPARLRIA